MKLKDKKDFKTLELNLIVIDNDVITTSGFDGPVDNTWFNLDDGGML